jgi:hypothetical protein
MRYSALLIVAAAVLVAAVPLKYGDPGYVLQSGDPGYKAPAYSAPAAYGGEKKGYGGYGGHKGETRELGIVRLGHAIHDVGHEVKEQIKSDVHRVINWMTCHTDKFKKYWKLKLEYRRNKLCEFKRLEKEKLAKFEAWCEAHKEDLRKRLQECSDSSSSSSEKAIYKETYTPPPCGSTGATCANKLY